MSAIMSLFVVDKDLFAKSGEDVDEIDCFLCMGWRIPKLERFGKPVVIWQNGNEGIDFAAYCRSIGVEAYVCMDLQDVNEIMHILWVRKAVRNTRALVLTAGSQPIIRNSESDPRSGDPSSALRS